MIRNIFICISIQFVDFWYIAIDGLQHLKTKKNSIIHHSSLALVNVTFTTFATFLSNNMFDEEKKSKLSIIRLYIIMIGCCFLETRKIMIYDHDLYKFMHIHSTPLIDFVFYPINHDHFKFENKKKSLLQKHFLCYMNIIINR